MNRIETFESAYRLNDELSEYSCVEKLVRECGMSGFLDIYGRARDSMKRSFTADGNTEEGVDIPIQFILKATKDIEKELSSLTNREGEEEISLHDNVSCNLCNQFSFTPIRGPRFICLICSNYDLCSKCRTYQKKRKENDGNHAFSHPMVEIETPSLIETLKKDATGSNNYETKEALEFREENTVYLRNITNEISSKYQALGGCRDIMPKSGSGDKGESHEKGISNGEESKRTTENGNGVPVINGRQRHAYSDSHSLLLLMKKLTPNSSVFSITLHNESNTSIVGNFVLELFDGNRCESVIVKNDRPILRGTKRRFNIREISQDFDLLSNRQFKILTLTEVYHTITSFRPNNYNKLYLIKEAAAGPVQHFLSEACSVWLVPKLQNVSQVILKNIADTVLDFSKLKLQVIDCFGVVISKAHIMCSKRVEPERTLKINIGLDLRYLKRPFNLVVETSRFKGECYMNEEKQNGLLKVVSNNFNNDLSFLQEFDSLALCETCSGPTQVQKNYTNEEDTFEVQLNNSTFVNQSQKSRGSNEGKNFCNDPDLDIISQEDLSQDGFSDFEYLSSSSNEEI